MQDRWGVLVYENVVFPQSRFDRNGELIPITPWAEGYSFSEQMLGGDYKIVSSRVLIKDGKPFDKFFLKVDWFVILKRS